MVINSVCKSCRLDEYLLPIHFRFYERAHTIVKNSFKSPRLFISKEKEKRGIIYTDESEFMNGNQSQYLTVFLKPKKTPNHFPDLTRWHQTINRIISHTMIAQPPLRRQQSDTHSLKVHLKRESATTLVGANT